MGAMTWQTIGASLMLRDILEYEDTVSRSARVAMDQIKKELRVAFLTSNTTAVNTYQTVFIGDGGDEDQPVQHHGSQKKGGGREGDQAEVTLWIEKVPVKLSKFFSRESGRVDHEPEKGGCTSHDHPRQNVQPTLFRRDSMNGPTNDSTALIKFTTPCS